MKRSNLRTTTNKYTKKKASFEAKLMITIRVEMVCVERILDSCVIRGQKTSTTRLVQYSANLERTWRFRKFYNFYHQLRFQRPRAETTDKSDMSKRATTMKDYVTIREQPGEEIENPMGADQRAGNYGTKNDKLDITIQIISLCLTEEAPVYGQRSGLPAFLQLQLAGQTEVVGRFDLAPDPDTVVEINATTGKI